MIWLLLFLSFFARAVTIDRVILATNANPDYIQFWPLVAQAWQEIVGIKPTLLLIASSDVYVDEQWGEVIRFEPVEGIPTSYQAQVIRLFAPTLFPDDVCLLSDIDMIPLQGDHFNEQVKNIADDMFIIYRDKANDFYESRQMYPMCYVAAKGSVFNEIFNVDPESIREKLVEWYALNLGWCTDELMMAQCVNNWSHYPKRVCKLGNTGGQSIDRLNWKYDIFLLKKGQLIDAHLPRPYIKHKQTIDQLLIHLNLKSVVDLLPIQKFSATLIKNDARPKELVLHDENQIITTLLHENHRIITTKTYMPDSFIHFLTLESNGYEFLKTWRYQLENQQIGIIHFTSDENNVHDMMALLGDFGYVIFKIMPDGLMHIPQWAAILRTITYSAYVAFMPQYACGWSIYKNKRG